jgi:glycosyltransferase involved in cell wall biosynthesis
MKKPRIALFACSYSEVDGVANTVRQFERYAVNNSYPMLLIHGGFGGRNSMTGSVRRIEFRRRFPKFSVDKKHDFDLLFWRYYAAGKAAVLEFRPDIIHITGPSDVGMLGALLAHRLSIPLAASWHTNLHEYAERRAISLLPVLPHETGKRVGEIIRSLSMRLLARFYHIPQMLFAPNYELMELLQRMTGKGCQLMSRGVDVNLFSPSCRTRQSGPFTIGYVGRITVEKNVGMLIDLEKELLQAGAKDFRFLIVGQGALEGTLKENMTHADFAGVLHGDKLAKAYANMDAFVFPSHTDTFGNVVLEALASGVPAITTESGGPKFIVRHQETGFLTAQDADFCRFVLDLMRHPEKRQIMGSAARNYALGQSWDAVFDRLYQVYNRMLSTDRAMFRNYPTARPGYSAAGAST